MRLLAPAFLAVFVSLLASPALAGEVRHEGKSPQEWAEVLATGKKRFRHPAAEALSTHLEPYAAAAIPTLVEALGSEEGEVRHLASRCLGAMGAAARGEPAAKLVLLLDDPEEHVRCAAAEALGRIGDPSSIGALRQALAGESAELRACAAFGLGNYGEAASETAPALRALLEDESASVKAMAALALLRITGDVEAARPAVVSALKPPSGPTSRAQIHLRERVIRTLGEIGAPAGAFAPALVEIVVGDRSFARDFAAAALAELGTAGEVGIPALVEGLGDSTFRLAAAKALATFGPAAADAVPGLVNLLERPTWKEDAEVASTALGKIGPKAAPAVPVLAEVLAQGNDARSMAALMALGDLGETAKPALPGIRPLVKSRNAALHLAAVRALYLIEGEGADPALAGYVAALGSDEPESRLAAARLAGSLGASNDELLTALRAVESGDESAAARRSAAASLRALAE